MGVITDQIFIIIYNISLNIDFPIHLLCLPKPVINMLLVPVSSYEDVYEINVMFHNRKSYFDLKPHNIFLRC